MDEITRLNNRQKYERIRLFINELKSHAKIDSFLMLEELNKFGIYDFNYITKNGWTFQKVEKNFKDKRYDYLQQFINDLKQIFISVQDYVFEGDDQQNTCHSFMDEIDQFANEFIEEFKNKYNQDIKFRKIQKPSKREKQRQKDERPKPTITSAIATPILEQIIHTSQPMITQKFRERARSTLTQKLQMLFLLKSHEHNEPYIRSFGQYYGIGSQIDEEYVITLDNRNSQWLPFINKN